VALDTVVLRKDGGDELRRGRSSDRTSFSGPMSRRFCVAPR